MSQPLVVDAHTHFIPPDFSANAARNPAWQTRVEERDGAPWAVHEQGFSYPLYETFYAGEAKLRDMESRHIDVSLLSISPTLFYYWIDPAECRVFAKMANDTLADLVGISDHRFVGVATLTMQDPQAAAKELACAVQELGLLGAQIGTSVEGRQLDDPIFVPFWEAANELRAPIILHPYYVGSVRGLEDYYLTNSFGNPSDTALAASRIIMSGMLDNFPDLRLLLVHAGGFLPYQIGRFDRTWQVRKEARERASRPPSEYLEHFYFDTITHNDSALAWLCTLVGDERILLGTDLPYDMGDEDSVGRVERAIAQADSRDRIFGTNAVKLFGISPAQIVREEALGDH